ncbi:MAG: carboxypeptidase regulatory-like domain-containing protein [Deltaproteobacteria bacterium]|nr:carboxypeptidase regulatory-like domain-containing protein [Deltaproteobacteria bacterium]
MGLALLVGACGDDDDKTCDPVAATGCDEGLACEVVTGGTPACYAPVIVRGDVFDLTDNAGIGGARVVALDVNGSPQSSVAVTVDGNYDLRIPSERDADGAPVALTLTLRVDAAGFQAFPSGIRQPIPIDTSGAVKGDDGGYMIETAQTQVGLLPLAAGGGTASLAGNVELAPSRNGVLVVAESGTTGHSAIADRDGAYQIFNLPDGAYTVRAYSLEANYTPGMITLAGTQAGELDLALDAATTSTVSGTVNLVEGATPTSVILVVASTFDPLLARGETPPGLRAPNPGTAPNIDGPFSIAGVPAGRYVVLAGFENDGSVRDQSGTGGTSLVYIDVVGGQDLPIVDGFKVTKAIPIVSPGATMAESVTSPPVLTWVKDSSAKDYHVQVFDALGTIVMDHHTNDGAIVAVPFSGPLTPGMYYQFRVTSYDDASPTPFALANTEDLRGVFFSP